MKSRTGIRPPYQSVMCIVRLLHSASSAAVRRDRVVLVVVGLAVSRVRLPVARFTDQTSGFPSAGPPASTYVASAPPWVKVLNSYRAPASDQRSTLGSDGEVGVAGLITRGSVTRTCRPPARAPDDHHLDAVGADVGEADVDAVLGELRAVRAAGVDLRRSPPRRAG